MTTRRRRRAWWWAATGLAVMAAIAAAPMLMKEHPPSDVAAAPGARAARGELIEAASVSGTVQPRRQVEIHSQVAGEVVEVLVEEGSEVAAGAPLVRLDTVDADRRLRSAKSELQRARAALAEAKAHVSAAEAKARHAADAAARQTRGAQLGLTTQDTARQTLRDRDVAASELELYRAQVLSAKAQVVSASLAVEEAEEDRERTEIVSPFAGTVLAVNVERGTLVTTPMGNVSGGTSLFTLADLTDLRVIGQLDEAQVGKVAKGQTVHFRIDAYPEREFAGHVHRVSPLGTVDTNVVVFDVEIIVTDVARHLLRSGMSADVEIVIDRHVDALLVPLSAIRSRGAQREVLLRDGTRAEVETGATDGDSIVVLAGLSEGQAVVADGRSRADTAEPSRSGLLPKPPRGGPP